MTFVTAIPFFYRTHFNVKKAIPTYRAVTRFLEQWFSGNVHSLGSTGTPTPPPVGLAVLPVSRLEEVGSRLPEMKLADGRERKQALALSLFSRPLTLLKICVCVCSAPAVSLPSFYPSLVSIFTILQKLV